MSHVRKWGYLYIIKLSIALQSTPKGATPTVSSSSKALKNKALADYDRYHAIDNIDICEFPDRAVNMKYL